MASFGERVKGWIARRLDLVERPDYSVELEARREAVDVEQERALDTRAESLPIGMAGLDPDDGEFRRLSDGNPVRGMRRDLSPIQQERALQVSWYLSESNGLAKRVLELTRDLVVGESVTCSTKDEALAPQLQTIWKRIVGSDVGELYYAASLNGELAMPVARNVINGMPRYGFIDPMMIQRVEFSPEDAREVVAVVLKKSATDMSEGQRFEVVREDPETGQLVGDLLYWRLNALPNSGRGRPDLLTLADMIDLYDQMLYGNAEGQRALSAFVWDLEVDTTDEKEIKKKVDALGRPKSGQVFGHNKKEQLKAITPNLQSGDRAESIKSVATHIGGVMGFALSWLGFPDSNRATIEGQNDILFKTPKRRQNQFKSFLELAIRYGVEGISATNPVYYADRDLSIKVEMPEIASKDVARVGSVISSVVQGMDTAIANGTMSKRHATVLTIALLKHLGVDFEVEEVVKQIDDEFEKRSSDDDERAAMVANARAKAQGDGFGGIADGRQNSGV